MNYDEANKRIHVQEERLARAKRTSPEAVIHTVTETYADWDTHPAFRNAQDVPVWPDHWHLWQRALEDAEFAIAHKRPARY